MLAKDVMTHKPEYIGPHTSLKEAAVKMHGHDHGFLPIGENDRLIGTITDRDLTVRAVAKGRDPNKTEVKDVMSERLHYCFENDNLKKVADKMKHEKIRRLVVLNDAKRMTGIISIGDIVTKSQDPKITHEILEIICEEARGHK